MSAFDVWNAAGRPLTPAQPIREFVEKLKAAFPAHANEFNWFADEAHYREQPPQDHTPFSADGWPRPDPHWVVFATDVMNTAVGGLAGNQKLFNYWLAEAKAGRAPWIKYLIWQATIYDVRFGWRPQPNSDHFDHVHISARTDFEHYSLGGWSVTPSAPTTGEEAEVMRFVFTKTVGGDGRHVYVTDGLRYRVQPLAFEVDGWLAQAGAGPVVAIDHKPANWSFDMLVSAVCGRPDPGEFAGGNADGSGLTAADLTARTNASTVTIAPAT